MKIDFFQIVLAIVTIITLVLYVVWSMHENVYIFVRPQHDKNEQFKNGLYNIISFASSQSVSTGTYDTLSASGQF